MASWKGSRHVDIVAVHPSLFAITANLNEGKRPHSYLLLHDAGNLLFHGSDQVSFYKEHADFFARHGGIAKHVLTHGAEAFPACLYVERTLGAPVYLHNADVPYATKKAKAPIPASFHVRHRVYPHLEAIPMPGHSLGFTSYLWDSNPGRYVFAGDIFFRRVGRWTAYVHPLLAEDGIKSLKALRALDVDFLLPNQSLADQPIPAPFDATRRGHLIDQVIHAVARKHRITAQ
jgi:glyoxylase-like metal-dependent hydrolase (beta-lactamase superfamily II)